MISEKKLILFDFDGVIVDSFELSFQAAADAGSPLTREQQRKLFEGNLFESLKKIKVSKDHEQKYYDKYVPSLFETPPMEGMSEVIETLGKLHRLVIVSSTVSSPIQGYLSMYKLDRYFDWILGGDVHKNKTTKIKMVLKEYEAKAEDCIFITDTLGDIKEAAKCNVQSIGVTWGFHEAERLEKGNPFMVIDKPTELLGAVEKFFLISNT